MNRRIINGTRLQLDNDIINYLINLVINLFIRVNFELPIGNCITKKNLWKKNQININPDEQQAQPKEIFNDDFYFHDIELNMQTCLRGKSRNKNHSLPNIF